MVTRQNSLDLAPKFRSLVMSSQVIVAPIGRGADSKRRRGSCNSCALSLAHTLCRAAHESMKNVVSALRAFSPFFPSSVAGRQPTSTNRSLVLMSDACHVIGHRRYPSVAWTNDEGNIISDIITFLPANILLLEQTSESLGGVAPSSIHPR